MYQYLAESVRVWECVHGNDLIQLDGHWVHRAGRSGTRSGKMLTAYCDT